MAIDHFPALPTSEEQDQNHNERQSFQVFQNARSENGASTKQAIGKGISIG